MLRKTTRRLIQVIVGSPREAADAIGVSNTAAEDDHWQVRVDSGGESVGSPDAVQQSEAAPVLQTQVEHHQRGLTHLDRA